ncbi:MAG: sigma 54-interacting transcriptional regulator [Bryobacteraceae bacterium]
MSKPVSAEARLEALAGPRQGEVFALGSKELSIGRDPENDISVLDSSASRRHCVIRLKPEGFELTDLESRNTTQVNDLPVKARFLANGDRIRVGKSEFIFTQRQPSTESEAAMPADSATVVLRREDARYLRAPGESVIPANARTVRDLNALVAFGRTIGVIRNRAELEQKTLESILEVTPAERAAIVRLEDESADSAVVTGLDRKLGPGQAVALSRTIVNQVIEQGAAVLCNNVPDEEALQESESLISRRVRSVLAVPLEVADKLIGVIYVDTSDPRVRFDADHLQLLAALGNVAALAIGNAAHVEWLEGENSRLRAEINLEMDMVGESPAMQKVFQFVARVAPRDSTVLVWGESGTGKELVARAIHRNSARADKPFVAINCAAISDHLLESELFGHEKGSFTGATAQKRGKLEVADGGTVFLDEIGELAPALQAKLLRVLQEREFERVGGTRPIKLDIRLVAATNRDLKEESRQKRFREDLYYRLNVVSLQMPALRERPSDIAVLASFFADKYARKLNRKVSGISPKTLRLLTAYGWPGNVRELENTIERAVVLGVSDVIEPEDLPDSLVEEAAPGGEPVTALHEAIVQAKKQAIEKAIELAGGNYTEAARQLGVHPNHLFRLIRTLNMKTKRARA